MEQRSETVELTYKGYKYTVTSEYWYCTETKESFTTSEQDQKALDELHKKHNDFMILIASGFQG